MGQQQVRMFPSFQSFIWFDGCDLFRMICCMCPNHPLSAFYSVMPLAQIWISRHLRIKYFRLSLQVEAGQHRSLRRGSQWSLQKRWQRGAFHVIPVKYLSFSDK
jgi:hypothetical protein